MRRKTSDYKREIKDEPFELELEATKKVRGKAAEPVVVKFVRPSDRVPIEMQDKFANWKPGDTDVMDPRRLSIYNMLGEDKDAFDQFWAEWGRKYPKELDDLVADVDKHFNDGLDQGKGSNSTG